MRKRFIFVALVVGIATGVHAEVEPTAEATEAYNAYVEAYKGGDLATAEAQLKAAITAQADWGQPYIELGQLYIQQKKFGDAATQVCIGT